jgi:hypothetical protein
MRPTHPWKGSLSHVLATAVQAALLVVIVAGVLIRVLGLFLYMPDSGDEWVNTVAPFRVLFDRGNPNAFFHPSGKRPDRLRNARRVRADDGVRSPA